MWCKGQVSEFGNVVLYLCVGCWAGVGVLFVTSIKSPSKVAYSFFFFFETSFEIKTALFWVITLQNNPEERSSHRRNSEITQVSKWVCPLPPNYVPRVDNNNVIRMEM